MGRERGLERPHAYPLPPPQELTDIQRVALKSVRAPPNWDRHMEALETRP